MTTLYRITEEVVVPKGTNAEFKNTTLTIKGAKGTLVRKFSHPRITITLQGDKVKVETIDASRKEKALVGTWAAHVKNMIQGVNKHFIYTMKAVYAHFPVKLTVKDKELVIENFLGEHHPRRATILGETTVTVKGQDVTLEGPALEDVSQTAANIENTTKVKDRDPRVFQDGIYITMKGE